MSETIEQCFRDVDGYHSLSPADAVTIQTTLAPHVERTQTRFPVRTIAGADTAFPGGGDGVGRQMAAAIVVLDADTLDVVETVTATGTVEFDYLPGLLSFRELPLLAHAWAKLETPVDVLMVDGYGLLHPRQFGLACHAGLLFDVPCIGVAKNRYVGQYPLPAEERGACAPVHVDGTVLGRSVRTREHIKPVYVSAGHKIGLDFATELTLRCAPEFRVPEPTRQADMVVNDMVRSEAAIV